MDEAVIRDTLLQLCDERGPEKTICPSEVARQLSDDWRGLMPQVREVAFRLAERGTIEVLQQGQIVDGATAKGPIRLRISDRQ